MSADPPERDRGRTASWIQFACVVGILAAFAIKAWVPAAPSPNAVIAALAAIALGVLPDSLKAFTSK